jgi:hypothetical protein
VIIATFVREPAYFIVSRPPKIRDPVGSVACRRSKLYALLAMKFCAARELRGRLYG